MTRVFGLALFAALTGCSTAKLSTAYLPAEGKPTATIRFVVQPPSEHPLLAFYDKPDNCTQKFYFPAAQIPPSIRFDRHKRFAFRYYFGNPGGGPGISYTLCGGLYEFTPVANSYTVYLTRGEGKCYVQAVEEGSGPVPLVTREPLKRFFESDPECAPIAEKGKAAGEQ